MTTFSSIPSYVLGSACFGRGVMAILSPRKEYGHVGLQLEHSAAITPKSTRPDPTNSGLVSPLMYFKGIREISYGLALMALQWQGNEEAVTTFAAVLSLVRIGDGLARGFPLSAAEEAEITVPAWIHCQLCGVPFAVGRTRTRNEPWEAAWGPGRRNDGPTWVGGSVGAHGSCKDPGCALAYRGPVKWVWGGEYSNMNLDDDDSNDGTYEDGSETDSEPLEYDSSASEDGEVSKGAGATDDSDDGSLEPRPWSFAVWPSPNAGIKLLPLSTLDSLRDDPSGGPTATQKACEYEHISGPGCTHLGGYHGDRISAEEMRGCTTVQCLVRKLGDWYPRSDDLRFERESKFHLTGLSDDIDGGGGVHGLSPIRNWVSHIIADNDVDHPQVCSSHSLAQRAADRQMSEDAPEFGAAFHPTCFELFLIASRRILGHVDVDGLVELRKQHCRRVDLKEKFYERDDGVKRGEGQVWTCHLGDEYLAANPIFIPGFRDMCDAASSRDDDFSVQHSAFQHRQSGKPSNTDDPFLRLPAELVSELAAYLTPKDIASVRHSSRAFAHLPISLWHKFLQEDFPFVYEAWCENVRSNTWAFYDAVGTVKDGLEVDDSEEDFGRRVDIIRPYGSEALAKWDVDKLRFAVLRRTPEYRERVYREYYPHEPRNLPFDKTNWFQLYCDVAAGWKEVKGLRNRARIWVDVCDIVEKIKQLQERKVEE
ncbi:hypothetical protein AK830_g6027 [Neonectria ditissima]|uniref:F-box domain-containing protein n=1 Tax=Neonectria ditissima TaxID=78410 RepID=A0A0P7BDA6_9HYPO|nr:hypothetical protein AK830_g6027 [Neonectria ditissima]